MRRTSSHSPPPLLPPSPLPSPSPVCFLSPTLPIPFKPVFKRPRSVATPLIHACHRPAPPTARTLSLTAALAASLLLPLAPASAKTLLTENTIFRRYLVTDSAAILRYSLPLPSERQKLPDPAPIRLVQESLEKLGVHLRARGAAGLIAGRRDLVTLRQLLSQRQLDILLDVPARSRKLAAVKLADLERIVSYIQDNLGTSTPIIGDGVLPTPVLRFEQNLQDVFTPRNTIKQVSNYDAAHLEALRLDALQRVADIEEISVDGTGLPFRIPRRYNSLPRLMGRARVEFVVQKKNGTWRPPPTEKGKKAATPTNEAKMIAVLDGYSAPLTAGNFVDLSRRKYYDNTRILSTQRNFFAQMGEREDDENDGFVDPSSGRRRRIPLEILANGEPTPAYGATLDDLGIGDLQPVLPISAFGAIAMVHSVEDANDASSQFYIFMMEPTSYTARSYGGSVLTGSLATFGYIVEGKELLPQLEKGDMLLSVKVISGENNFKQSG